MGLTDINYDRILKWLLPIKLRRPGLWAWVRVITYPIHSYLYPKYKENEAKNWYEIKHTPAVAHMEGVLNDRFDNSQRRIFITDGEIVEPDYIYIIPEELPVFIYTAEEVAANPSLAQILYTEDETVNGLTDFIIHVPQALIFDMNELIALVQKYRLSGKSYSVTFF